MIPKQYEHVILKLIYETEILHVLTCSGEIQGSYHHNLSDFGKYGWQIKGSFNNDNHCGYIILERRLFSNLSNNQKTFDSCVLAVEDCLKNLKHVPERMKNNVSEYVKLKRI